MSKQLVPLLAAVLATLALPGITTAQDIFWPIGAGLEAQISPTGRLSRVTHDGRLVVGAGQLFLLKAHKGGTIYQSSGFVAGKKAKIQQTDSEVTARGALLDDPSPGAPKAVDYTLVYRKAGDGALLIHVEVTLLQEAEWQSPPRFSVAFPIDDFTGAEFSTEDQKGTQRTYPIDDKPVTFEGYGFRSATISRDGMQILFEPAAGTSLHVQDTRTWGGDYLKVDLSQEQKWKAPFAYKTGEKQVFEFKLIVTGTQG